MRFQQILIDGKEFDEGIIASFGIIVSAGG